LLLILQIKRLTKELKKQDIKIIRINTNNRKNF